MPRFSSFQVRSAQILDNSPPLSVESKRAALQNKNYTSLSNDLKISWDGDLKIDPNTGDYALSFNLEAFTQRLYRRMITNIGNYPGDTTFGWNFEYLFSLSLADQKIMLPTVAKTVKASLESDPEVASVGNIRVYIERIDWQTHKIVIETQVIPLGYNQQVNIALESV